MLLYNITIALDPFSILLVLTNIIPTPTFLLRIPSPGIAYAYVNSWNSVYSNQWCNYVSAQVHEIGHNIGLAHSNEGSTTYADQSGMMGYSYGNESAPKMCFNAAKNNQLGWYADKTTIVTPSSATGNCFAGSLYGTAKYGDAAAQTVGIKVNNPSSSTDVYIMYNAQTGIQSGTQEGGPGS